MPAPRKSAVAIAVGLALACVVAIPREARAAGDDKSAAQSFQAGATAYARREYRQAAAAFENAYRIAPRGAAVYNAGLAWEGAGESARAADAYQAALARSDLSEVQARDAQARLTQLERALGRLQVNTLPDATVSVDKAGGVRGSGMAHVSPGEREVSVLFADGRSETRRIHVFAGALAVVEIMAPTQAPAPATAVPVFPVVAQRPRDEAPPATSASSGGLTRAHAGWITIGGAGVLLLAGGLLGQSALHKRNDFDASGHTNSGLHDSAASLRIWTNVALGAAAVAAGVGIYLLLTPNTPDADGAPTTAELHLGPTDVRLRVCF